MKILLVMDRRIDRGSIQASANYLRTGDELGHEIALYGSEDPAFPALRFSTDLGAFEYVVFLVESWRHWMSGLRMPRFLSEVPRERRAILDADGMYNQIVSVDGYDRTFSYEHDRAGWLAHYQVVADKIMQPTFAPREPGVIGLPFYGYDPASRINSGANSSKCFDILCVGHNWWRWRQISTELLPAIEQVRSQIGEIGFIGSWWDMVPAGATELDLQAAFGTDPDWLRRLRIQVKPAVPFTEVIPRMSTGRLNIMTQRPLFTHLKLLTSKYFEIFAADTVPLVMLDPDHAASIYGPAGRELALHGAIAEKLLDALNRPQKYRDIVEEVRRHLTAHHSYRNRVQELVAALEA
ncbi:MAG: glycosyltransferase family 1 protein [Pyrinomonadaceae bacterium]|nr:glycosyltransferase family 1 protein [Pyrinomonadaceae bacterium]